MRNYPIEETDKEEAKNLNASEWQLNALKMNPEYVSWGNYEDSPIEYESFSEMFGLNDLNECVNFYFEIYRKNHECPHCHASGLNPETYQLSKDWYDFEGTGRKWNDKINDIEVEALVKAGRLWDFMPEMIRFDNETNKWLKVVNNEWAECEKPEMPSAEVVNSGQTKGGYFGHDAINRWICIESRAKQLGIYGNCEHCEKGSIYDEPTARLALQLWILHPRKGASRGVYIKNILESELPAVMEWLKVAAQRNAERFSKL